MSIPLNALIVDDSEDDVLLITRALEKGGFSVHATRVETTETLLEALAGRSCDVVIADHSMPKMDSFDALRLVHSTGQDIPFVIVSRAIGEETAVEVMKAGAHDFVLKENLNRLGPVVERGLREAVIRSERRRAREELVTREHDLFAAEHQARQDADAARQEILALYEASNQITASLDLSTTLDNILDAVVRLSASAAAGIAFVDSTGSQLNYEATRGPSSMAIRGMVIPMGWGTTGAVAASGEFVAVPDVSKESRWLWPPAYDRESIRSAIFFPLKTDEGVIGMLCAYSLDIAHFTPSHERLLRGLGDQATIAIGRARDVARRAEAEEALRRSEQYFRLLIERATDVIAVLNADGTVRYASPRGEQVFGLAPERMIGTPALELVHPDDLPEMTDTLAKIALSPGVGFGFHFRGQHADGTWREVDATGINLLANPAVSGIVVSLRDVTERHGLEEQLRQSQKMEAIGQLAGGVAHDFNNLLTVILGFGEMMLDEIGEDPGMRERLGMMLAAGESAVSLTRQLLAFSRRQVVTLQDVDLNAAIEQLTRMLRRLIGEDVALTTRFAPDLGMIRADSGQLDQVLMNLATNSRDAMPSGGTLSIVTKNVRLAASDLMKHPSAKPGPYVAAEVSDTGSGMDASTIARIFEPFYTTKEVGKGTGLGLAAVFGIVTQAGGFIDVRSEVGKGTTFFIFWPRLNEASAAKPASTPRRRLRGGTETILLVEDDVRVRTLARVILQTNGYTVLEAESGNRALAVQRETSGPIDLILSDVVMPGMSGREAVELIRKERPNAHILFMSGYTDDMVIRNGVVDLGASYFNKPFTPASLTDNVRKALDLAPAAF